MSTLDKRHSHHSVRHTIVQESSTIEQRRRERTRASGKSSTESASFQFHTDQCTGEPFAGEFDHFLAYQSHCLGCIVVVFVGGEILHRSGTDANQTEFQLLG